MSTHQLRPSRRRSILLTVALAAMMLAVLPTAAWAGHLELGDVQAADNVVGHETTYTVTLRIGAGNGNLAAGDATIRIIFPAGYDVSDATFDAAASGVRESDSGPFDPFPDFTEFDVDTDARSLFIRNIDYATTAGVTMFQVVFPGVVNPTTSGAGSVQISVLNAGGGNNTNGNVSFTVANGPVDRFSVTTTGLDPIPTQAAGVPFDVRIRALDSFGNLVNGTGGGDSFTGTVDLTSNVSGSAGLTTTPAFVAGVLAEHEVTLTGSHDEATLTATETGGAASGTSDAFEVTHGPADHLAVVEQPTTTAPGEEITPAVQVEVRDEFGNRVSDDNGTEITASLEEGSAGAALGGTTAQETVDGVASFDDLTVDAAGTGYVLRFSAGGFDPVDSDPFDVGVQVPEVELGDTTSTPDGFTFRILNHDERFDYTAESSDGEVAVAADGLVTVSGLAPNTEAEVTVTATARPGSDDLGEASATTAGSSLPTSVEQDEEEDEEEALEPPAEDPAVEPVLPATGSGVLVMLVLALLVLGLGSRLTRTSEGNET